MINNPRGTRDFNALEISNRQQIVNIITQNFKIYGFQPIETPSFEYSDLLLQKYGDEADKLIFRILDSGDVLGKIQNPTTNNEFITSISKKSLRYDQTVPMARYVQNFYNELNFPFRRYQTQLVWRADRPQKGRYREFLQCDADIIGSSSLMAEADLIHIFCKTFQSLGLHDFSILMNHRGLFHLMSKKIGLEKDRLPIILLEIDKLSKIGYEQVVKNIQKMNLRQDQMLVIDLFIQPTKESSFEKIIEKFLPFFGVDEDFQTIIKDFKDLFLLLNNNYSKCLFTPNLARGLEYYTGFIFEVVLAESSMGSIASGGRYDDLVTSPKNEKIPSVGISFGVDRIYDVLKERKKLAFTMYSIADVIFFNMGEEEVLQCYFLAEKCREKKIKALVFDKKMKLDKQFKYAEKNNIFFSVIIGSEELKRKKAQVKNLKMKKQEEVDFDKLPSYLLLGKELKNC